MKEFGEGFDAVLEGVLHGVAFSASVSVKKCDNGRHLSIDYVAPAGLCGLRIEAQLSGERGVCEVVATLGEVRTEVEAELLSQLLLPLLVCLNEEPPRAVEERGDGSVAFYFSDGGVWTFSGNGVPLCFAAPSLTMQVSDFSASGGGE